MVKFKDFSWPLCVFQVLFKANFIFKDFSRQYCIFKYFSSLCEPCLHCRLMNQFMGLQNKKGFQFNEGIVSAVHFKSIVGHFVNKTIFIGETSVRI